MHHPLLLVREAVLPALHVKKARKHMWGAALSTFSCANLGRATYSGVEKIFQGVGTFIIAR